VLNLIRLRPKGQLTIPDDIRRKARVTAGDYLAVSVRDGVIVLEPKTVIDSSQSWFWTEEWQSGEREASEDLAAGRTRHYESDEDFLASLD
jgi:AbrB family looped-hinge helix DNA binding protein